VLGRCLGITEEALEVGERLGDLAGGHMGPPGDLSLGLLAVETFHRRLPCRHVPVDFKTAGGVQPLPADASGSELVWHGGEAILDMPFDLGDERRVGGDLSERTGSDPVVDLRHV
jgi:hypothetical protein